MTFAGRREMCKADMGSVFKNRNTACRTFAQIMSLVTKMNYIVFGILNRFAMIDGTLWRHAECEGRRVCWHPLCLITCNHTTTTH